LTLGLCYPTHQGTSGSKLRRSRCPSSTSRCWAGQTASRYENSANYSTRDSRRRENTATESSPWWNSCKKVRHDMSWAADVMLTKVRRDGRFDASVFCSIRRADRGAAAGTLPASSYTFACGGTRRQAHRHIARLNMDPLVRFSKSGTILHSSHLRLTVLCCSISTILSPSYDLCPWWQTRF